MPFPAELGEKGERKTESPPTSSKIFCGYIFQLGGWRTAAVTLEVFPALAWLVGMTDELLISPSQQSLLDLYAVYQVDNHLEPNAFVIEMPHRIIFPLCIISSIFNFVNPLV
jgi:hypothetical protein